jgi:Flp pilus assembly protein TadG
MQDAVLEQSPDPVRTASSREKGRTGWRRRRGSAAVETALLAPWLYLLFAGTVDLGFYNYAAICAQNAARAGAVRAATGSSACSSNSVCTSTACPSVLAELDALPNATGLSPTSSCSSVPTSSSEITNSMPVALSATLLTCNTTPKCADCISGSGGSFCSATGSNAPQSAQVTVTYQTIPMFPIPGLVMGRLTLTREAQARTVR